ncbi:transcriptional regulator [Enterococcus faecalis]|nr:transcriptional regulator [Enterococcus faecalis]
MRKEYDHWKIEITRWNKGNIVTYISCDCGELAALIRWKRTEYECKSCGSQYKRVFGGQYIETKRRGDE